MRSARILGPEERPANYYHVMSRAIEGRMIFDGVAKEKFRKLLDAYLRFSGIECVTFCIMGNHFHLLLVVPSGCESLRAMDDAAFVKRLRLVYPARSVDEVAQTLARLREQGATEAAEKLREQFFARMHDLSAFMRELKQRFTQWHNRRVKRRGPLWQDRFKSVLVEGSEEALRTMAAYIDLNPVRAKLVTDPKDYRWCGYAEAVAGKGAARRGLMHLMEGSASRWSKVLAVYRCWLYADGVERRNEAGEVIKAGFSRVQSAEVWREQGRLGHAVLVKMRIRHFTEGAAFGSRAFLEEVFEKRREKFGPTRKDGARPIHDVRWGELMSLRTLRKVEV